LKQVIVKVGKPVKFDVNVKGEPAPKVVWMLKEKEVTEDNVVIINVDYNTKFEIKEGKRINSGMYKIVATNEHGKDEAEVEIVILGAPGRLVTHASRCISTSLFSVHLIFISSEYSTFQTKGTAKGHGCHQEQCKGQMGETRW